MEFNMQEIAPFIPHITGVAAVLLTTLIGSLCCPRRAATSVVTASEERNSRLAMLLMILLSDKPNRKYLRMAKQIGIDHIVTDDTLFDSSDEDSE